MTNIIELTAESFQKVITKTDPENLIELYFYSVQATECAEINQIQLLAKYD
jgi:putative thioredoxin